MNQFTAQQLEALVYWIVTYTCCSLTCLCRRLYVLSNCRWI